MKRLIFLLLAGAILMWASTPFAQITNTMGLTTSEDSMYGQCISGPGLQSYIAHVYIQNPENPDFGAGGSQPVSWINGFECRLWIEGDATVLGWSFPVAAVNAGTNGNTVVGFGEPVPVIDGFAIVATVEIFLGNPDGNLAELKNSPQPCENYTAVVNMAPTRPTSSIEGMLAYLDADDPNDPLVGATTDWSGPNDIVMLLEAWTVAVEKQLWGGIKALYR